MFPTDSFISLDNSIFLKNDFYKLETSLIVKYVWCFLFLNLISGTRKTLVCACEKIKTDTYLSL